MVDVWSRLSVVLPPITATPHARAAVLVALYDDASGATRVILTKRPDDMRTHPGDVVFPGGRIEAGEDAVSAAIREAWEEIALPGGAVDVIGALSPTTARNRELVIVPVVARVERPAELVPDPSEVDAIIEPTIDELLDETRWAQAELMGHMFWFFEFPEGVMWGATAFMMRELLGYLR